MLMSNEESIECFNGKMLISPASGVQFTVNSLLRKFYSRSIINAEKSLQLYDKTVYSSGYGDQDCMMTLVYKSESVWSNSPSVSLTCTVPVHVSCNNQVSLGYGADERFTEWEDVYALFSAKTETWNECISLSLENKEVYDVVKYVFFNVVEYIKCECFRREMLQKPIIKGE